MSYERRKAYMPPPSAAAPGSACLCCLQAEHVHETREVRGHDDPVVRFAAVGPLQVNDPRIGRPRPVVELARYKRVACLYHAATRAAAFRTLDTGAADFGRLFAAHPGAVVVVEASGNAGWAADLAAEHGLAVKVANTSGEAWRFTHLKRKTDRDDALRLAELEALGQLPTVTLPDPATRQRRALIAHRQALVGRRVAAPNRIR